MSSQSERRSTPPTPRPNFGQGPWLSEMSGHWWIVAESAAEALTAVSEVADPDMFPPYYGWSVKVAPCLIRWADDYDGEEVCISEARRENGATTQAWRISWEGL